jgi:hypothetical protein
MTEHDYLLWLAIVTGTTGTEVPTNPLTAMGGTDGPG